jgi:hypothetical protein
MEDDEEGMLAEAGENRIGSNILAAFKRRISDMFDERGADME